MAADRQPSRRPSRQVRWASQLRRVALVAVLAIASSALLPLVHGAATHFGDCGVCSVFAHGASVADVVSTPAFPPVVTRPRVERFGLALAPSRPALDLSEARAPPATSVSI